MRNTQLPADILEAIRAAIIADGRTINEIAAVAKVSNPSLYRLMNGMGIDVNTAVEVGQVVGLRIEIVCESIVEP